MMKLLLKVALTLMMALVLASCGGGGGGGGDGGNPTSVTLQPGSAITFTMTYGTAAPAAKTVQATYKGDGLVVGYAPGTPVAEWLHIEDITPSGSPNPALIKLSVNPHYTPGVYTTSIRFATGSASSGAVSYKDLPVKLTVNGPSAAQPQTLYAGRNGIALTSLPGLSKLTDTVKIYTTAVSMGTLGASSDAAWLGASASGSDILLTADPTGLGNGMHYATVTVSSSVSGMSAETLRVGLYVGDTAPADATSFAIATAMTATVAVDPVRPWVYVANAPTAGSVSALNIYTGQVDATFASISSGTTLTSIVPSSDGRYLFAHGYGGTTFHKLDIDANSWTDFTVAAQELHIGPIQMYYLRPAGRPTLLTDTGVLINATTTTTLNSTELPQAGEVYLFAVADDQRRLAKLQRNVNGAGYLYMFTLDYYPTDNMFKATYSGGGPSNPLAYPTDLAMNRAGTRLHATGNPDLIGYDFDGTAITLMPDFASNAFPSSIVIDSHNTAYFTVSGPKIQAYSPTGSLLKEIATGAAGGDNGLQISADGQLLLVMYPSGNPMVEGAATTENLVIYRTVH